MATVRYDTIGQHYSQTRREDPQIGARIHGALGNAKSVLNVGAGTGSYEPTDRHVLAIEPSDVMAAQRPFDRVPAIRASATSLPLRDAAVDAAMAILTLHHWDDRERGVHELLRVTRDRIVILTYDPDVSTRWWLITDYAPEIGEFDIAGFPPMDDLIRWLGEGAEIQTVPIPRDCRDWMSGSFWAHPERVLNADARAATSAFARLQESVVDRIVGDLSEDLDSGAWDKRYGSLRGLEAYDTGLRLVTLSRGTRSV
ncbi:MAG: class I SAM-dependent methyltransferase [Planctomycetota bacterium]